MQLSEKGTVLFNALSILRPGEKRDLFGTLNFGTTMLNEMGEDLVEMGDEPRDVAEKLRDELAS